MPMSPRLLLPRQAIHPEAADWANRVRTNGGSVSGTTLTAVDRFVKAIVAAGIRDRFYRLNLFCGNSDASLNAVRTPLYRGPSLGGTQFGNATDTNVNFVQGDYAVGDGLQGGTTTKYLATGITPDTVGVATGHLSLSLKGKSLAANGSDYIAMGSQNAGAAQRYALLITTSGNLTGTGTDYMARGWWGSTATTTHTTSGSAVLVGGQYLWTRTSGTRTDLYQNGTSVANSTASVSPGASSTEIWVMANNQNGTAGPSGPVVVRGYSIGLSMTGTQAAAYSTAMAALNAALGRTA